ncbi:MAG: hypothetical protein V4618_12695 [Pseudomonadota bacterium]
MWSEPVLECCTLDHGPADAGKGVLDQPARQVTASFGDVISILSGFGMLVPIASGGVMVTGIPFRLDNSRQRHRQSDSGMIIAADHASTPPVSIHAW